MNNTNNQQTESTFLKSISLDLASSLVKFPNNYNKHKQNNKNSAKSSNGIAFNLYPLQLHKHINKIINKIL